jgi:hypothetical protein
MKLTSIGMAALVSMATGMVMATQVRANSVGSVTCSSMRGEVQQRDMAFSAIRPSDEGGYTVLIVEETGTTVLSLNAQLQVTNASSLEGQILMPWNLTAYDDSPLKIEPSGAFSLSMMVSTRSSCEFQGTALFLQGAEATLFKN